MFENLVKKNVYKVEFLPGSSLLFATVIADDISGVINYINKYISNGKPQFEVRSIEYIEPVFVL
jgi:hypothetical protein